MRYVFLLIICLWAAVANAQDWEDRQRFGDPQAAAALRILSNTDTRFFAPIIDRFVAGNAGVQVDYMVTGSATLFNIYREDPQGYDVVISSAMDLQIKLANDGYALQVTGTGHPAWAQWRESLFAFSTEPAAIVINKAAFAGQPIPASRQELIQALRARPDVFADRIGTYDVRQSGLGYLFATQDARASETYWRLTEVMGGLGAKLYCCSAAMIDDLVSGKIAVAYNVLGSYAAARSDTIDEIAVILPSDFPTTMMRSAFASRDTKVPAAAAGFIRHLTTLRSDAELAAAFPLPPLDPASQASIPLEPALITYLDRLKRRTFIQEWENAIIQ